MDAHERWTQASRAICSLPANEYVTQKLIENAHLYRDRHHQEIIDHFAEFCSKARVAAGKSETFINKIAQLESFFSAN